MSAADAVQMLAAILAGLGTNLIALTLAEAWAVFRFVTWSSYA